MPISPEIVTAVGGAVAAVAAAFAGGKSGGMNSLNGFKEEVRGSFKQIDAKLDVLTKTDGEHQARIEAIEHLAERRLRNEPVYVERRAE